MSLPLPLRSRGPLSSTWQEIACSDPGAAAAAEDSAVFEAAQVVSLTFTNPLYMAKGSKHINVQYVHVYDCGGGVQQYRQKFLELMLEKCAKKRQRSSTPVSGDLESGSNDHSTQYSTHL